MPRRNGARRPPRMTKRGPEMAITRLVFTVVVDIDEDYFKEGHLAEGDNPTEFLAREISAAVQFFDVQRVAVTSGLTEAM